MNFWIFRQILKLIGYAFLFWFLWLLAASGLLLSPPAFANPTFVTGGAISASPFLAPAQAFRFKARMAANDILVLQWIAAPHYHLYRNRITLRIAPNTAHLAAYTLPPGKPMHIPGVGTLAVYEGDTTTIRVPVHFTGKKPKQITVTSSFQGCANAGVCYPVATRSVVLATTGPITGR